jgi:hypothetical protein
MLVLVYVRAYWWAARRPSSYPHLIVVALLGKILGPIGFGWAAATGRLPPAFGLTIVANDLIWLPAFSLYVRRRRECGAGSWLSSATLTSARPDSRHGDLEHGVFAE